MAHRTHGYEAKISEQISVVDAAGRELIGCTGKYKIAVRELLDQVKQFSVESSTKEVQTEEVQQQFQVATSDSLQRESTIRSLHMQLATLLQSLRTEREAKERLELEQRRWQNECEDLRLQLRAAQSIPEPDRSLTTALQQTVDELRSQLKKKESDLDSVLEDLDETRHKLYVHIENEKRQQSTHEQLQKECDDLRLQLRAAQSSTESDQSRTTALQQTVGDLMAQLQKKQSELGSVLEDLDETRNKLYGHMENEKRQQCLLTTNEVQTEKLRQNIRELESQTEAEKSQLQMELDSNRNPMFNDATLAAAQNEADNLKQELQRLERVEEEMNERMIALQQTANDLKTQLLNKQSELGSVLEDLDDTRHKLYEHMENEKRQQALLTANETQIRELKKRGESETEPVNERLAHADQQLRQSAVKLKESERNALEMQNYSSNLEAQIERMKRQLEKSMRMRDEVLSVTEQLRGKLDLELKRSAELEAELLKLKDAHAAVKADYCQMEQNLSQMLAKEHDLQTQLTEAQNRLRQTADEAIDHHGGNAQRLQLDSEF